MSGIPERVWKLKLPCHVDNAIMKHMETIIKKIDRNQIDQVIMEEAGSILKNGRSGGISDRDSLRTGGKCA